jgi:2-phosphosulfolactate phosphatase
MAEVILFCRACYNTDMEIRILNLIEGARQAEGMTVVIDVFRAFSLETLVLHNGAKRLFAVKEVEKAWELKHRFEDAVLIGERHGKILPGFDYGNSPYDVSKVSFEGKTVIHTTSAGTLGLSLAEGAKELLAGSLRNAKATADYIRSKHPAVVSLVCMGWEGKKQTEEDTLCADYLKSLLEGKTLAECGAQANAVASICVESLGAATARLEKPEIHRRYENILSGM